MKTPSAVLRALPLALLLSPLGMALAPSPAGATWLGWEGHPACIPDGGGIDGDCPDLQTACESWALFAGVSVKYHYLVRNPLQEVTSARCVMPGNFGEDDHVVTFPDCPAGLVENGNVASGCVVGASRADHGPSCFGDDSTPSDDSSLIMDLLGSLSLGNPINVATGNKHETETDFRTAGPRTLAFVRTYNSMVRKTSTMGPGWRHSFDRRLLFATGEVQVVRPDGRVISFFESGGQWNAASDVFLTLTAIAGGWELTTGADSLESYDAAGNLLTIDHRDGYQQNLLYDPAGRLESVTDSHGRAIAFTYNAQGLVETVTDPDGGVFRYGYAPRNDGFAEQAPEILAWVARPDATPLDPSDDPTRIYHYEDSRFPIALTGITDERGRRYATFAYDDQGRATLSEHAGGADSTTIAYNADGTRTVTNALGKQTIYSFQTVAGRPKLVQADGQPSASCQGAVRAQSYDANGFLASATDWEGHQSDFVHDARGLQTARTLAVGTPEARTVTTAWHASWRLPTQIVEPGLTTDLAYDGSGRLTGLTLTDTTSGTIPYSTNGETRTWAFSYDAAGLIATIDGPRSDVSDVTSFTHDPAGNLILVQNALGHQTQLSQHSGLGLPGRILNANGIARAISYDARGRPVAVTLEDPDGEATTGYAYDGLGQVTAVTLPNGSRLTYEYDDARRLTAIANDLGERLEYSYNALGNPISRSVKAAGGALQSSHSWVYDELGRLLDSIGAAGQTTSLAYDRNGRPVSVTDAMGETTLQAFDPLGRFVQATYPLAGDPTADLAYDAQDNLSDVTDPLGLVTTYRRNGFGEVIALESPDSGTTVFWRDEAGNLVSQTDARGVVTDFAYDALNRMTAKTFPAAPGEDVAYGYDDTAGGNPGIGRLTLVTDYSGSTALVYDARGRVTRQTRTIGGLAHVSETRYGPGRQPGLPDLPLGAHRRLSARRPGPGHPDHHPRRCRGRAGHPGRGHRLPGLRTGRLADLWQRPDPRLRLRPGLPPERRAAGRRRRHPGAPRLQLQRRRRPHRHRRSDRCRPLPVLRLRPPAPPDGGDRRLRQPGLQPRRRRQPPDPQPRRRPDHDPGELRARSPQQPPGVRRRRPVPAPAGPRRRRQPHPRRPRARRPLHPRLRPGRTAGERHQGRLGPGGGPHQRLGRAGAEGPGRPDHALSLRCRRPPDCRER